MKNAINWFEIPVKNFNRAKSFYATLFDEDIQEMPHPSYKYGMLPCDMQNGGVGGGIVEGDGFEPSMNGPLIYLNGGEDLSVPLSKLEAAGAKFFCQKLQ